MVKIIKEVDGMEESVKYMKLFEEKYGITSKAFANHDYDVQIEKEDICFWEFYIECFCECGGCL